MLFARASELYENCKTLILYKMILKVHIVILKMQNAEETTDVLYVELIFVGYLVPVFYSIHSSTLCKLVINGLD